jgi:hypothetical protein
MVQHDSSAPATKSDIKIIQDQLNFLVTYMGKLSTKDEMKIEIHDAIHGSEQRMLTVIEDFRYDMIGIHKDKITNHEERITKLELVSGSLR